MWEIALSDARKVCELIFAVSPLLGLTYLISDSQQFGLGPGAAETVKSTKDTLIDRGGLKIIRSGVRFYVCFVASMALASVGLIAPLHPWLLAATMTTFAASAYYLFSHAGGTWLLRLVNMRKGIDSKARDLPEGYTRFRIGRWTLGLCVLAGDLFPKCRRSKSRSASGQDGSGRVELSEVSWPTLYIYALTVMYYAGIAVLDCFLLFSAEIRQAGAI